MFVDYNRSKTSAEPQTNDAADEIKEGESKTSRKRKIDHTREHPGISELGNNGFAQNARRGSGEAGEKQDICSFDSWCQNSTESDDDDPALIRRSDNDPNSRKRETLMDNSRSKHIYSALAVDKDVFSKTNITSDDISKCICTSKNSVESRDAFTGIGKKGETICESFSQFCSQQSSLLSSSFEDEHEDTGRNDEMGPQSSSEYDEVLKDSCNNSEPTRIVGEKSQIVLVLSILSRIIYS